MPSYLERTMKLLKSQDCLVEKVEYFNAHSGRRHDMLGFLDLLVLHPVLGLIGVQVCGPGDFAEHERKILGPRREALIYWLLANSDAYGRLGGRCILIGWRNLKKPDPATGKPRGWTPRIREFTVDDLPEISRNTMDVLRRSVRADCPEWLLPLDHPKRVGKTNIVKNPKQSLTTDAGWE